MKENLVSTDLGLLSSDSANWLFKNNIISSDGSIRSVLVDGMIEKKAQMYSYFRWIIQDIREKIPTAPRQVVLGTDEMVEIMRNGSLEREYEVGTEKYHYIAKYPKVESIYNLGRKVCLEHQGKGKTKKDLVDFDD